MRKRGYIINMKNIALFGGSFNPPHPGHFEMAKYIYETLGVNEVWFLFSLNWQKDKKAYEATHHRMKMGQILADTHYSDLPFVMSDIQDQLGTHMTYSVLEALRKKHPDLNFIWVMGADSLESFHTWEDSDKIIENYPIAVLDRPGSTEKAKSSYTALTYPHLQTSKAADLCTVNSGWHFLNNPQIDLSSSHLLKQLHAGAENFDLRFQPVAEYIKDNGLYNLNTTQFSKNQKVNAYTKS